MTGGNVIELSFAHAYGVANDYGTMHHYVGHCPLKLVLEHTTEYLSLLPSRVLEPFTYFIICLHVTACVITREMCTEA